MKKYYILDEKDITKNGDEFYEPLNSRWVKPTDNRIGKPASYFFVIRRDIKTNRKK